jgi:6-pyruvoyltetrahydropterin/6-carboxytetrahydropterin synthase
VISQTRCYRFPASHRLHSARLSRTENLRVYGKCNNPFGHGHDYVLEITVSGELNAETGLLIPLPELDRFVKESVLRHFAYRNLNVDVLQFANLVPTTENMLRVIADLVSESWIATFGDLPVRVSRIQLQETDRNGFELFLPASKSEISSATRNESVMVDA